MAFLFPVEICYQEQPQPSKHHRERSPEQPRRPVWDCFVRGGWGKEDKHFIDGLFSLVNI